MVIHVRRWVLWWLCLGVIGGAIALPNILLRDLTHLQEKVLLLFGVLHWLLGGIICWAAEGVKVEPKSFDAAPKPPPRHEEADVLAELMAHHNRRTSPRHSTPRHEILTSYFLHH